MTDREKVVVGLTDSIEILSDFDTQEYTFSERQQLHDSVIAAIQDALELLKAQEPRLVTESDFDGADEYGYIPVWTEEKDGYMYWECIPKSAITDPDGIVVLRYWTSRPDQETREAIPWE